jgi:NitT/TauT family transport system ATP-binding protein
VRAPAGSASRGRVALHFKDVTCRFGDYVAVENASLVIGDGEFVSIVGPTGCGKSTLLNVAAGLLEPSEGTLLKYGEPVEGLNDDIGYLFQSDSLMPWRTALDNVLLGLEYRGERRAEAVERGNEWLRRVGLGAHGARYPHQMSGGMRRRCSLAQMLIMQPRILLMDEPFSALDVQTRLLMENELLDLWSVDRKSVVFITHDLEEAISLSDRVIVLSAGPRTRPIGEFPVPLPRPRDVSETRLTPAFLDLHQKIWSAMKDEVMKAYQRNRESLPE